MLDLVYLRYLSNYNKILKQRNAYLKQLMVNSTLSNDYLDILTEKLVYYGLEIHQKRKKFIGEINEFLGDFYEKITGYKNLQVMYLSSYNELSKEEISKLKKTLTSLNVKATETLDTTKAQVCSGGVSLEDLKENMESKKINHLYFIGEVVDVDGDCGGYNLGFAWRSGLRAGKSIRGEVSD